MYTRQEKAFYNVLQRMLDKNLRGEGKMNNTDITNQHYLLSEQYKDASHFNARLRIIQSLSAKPLGWYTWIFSHIKMAPNCRVLELGCGPGYLWRENLERIPRDWEITLSDFSPGMLEEAQTNLSSRNRRFSFQVIDAQAIPFEAATFDRVIANMMLYHVPDRERAFAEIRRVLKPDGYFYASTVSEAAFSGLEKMLSSAGLNTWMNAVGFTIENGAQQLSRWFSQVELHRLENTLVATEAEPLIGVIRTGTPDADYDEAKFQRLRSLIQEELAQRGTIPIVMDIGLFEASGRKS